jgi:hypothetical protein
VQYVKTTTKIKVLKRMQMFTLLVLFIDDYSELVTSNKRNIASLAAKGGWARPSRTYNRMPHYPF